jgi:hypothetical protein
VGGGGGPLAEAEVLVIQAAWADLELSVVVSFALADVLRARRASPWTPRTDRSLLGVIGDVPKDFGVVAAEAATAEPAIVAELIEVDLQPALAAESGGAMASLARWAARLCGGRAARPHHLPSSWLRRAALNKVVHKD